MTRVPRPLHPAPAIVSSALPDTFVLASGRVCDELNAALPEALHNEQWALLYEAAEAHVGPRPADAETLAAAIIGHLQARRAQCVADAHLQALVDQLPHWTVAHWVAVTDATRRYWRNIEYDGLTTDPRHWALGERTRSENDGG